ncbi:hypothetical protein FB45DRAFT_869538 [Roridomyces roridus]|uniref:DUF6729 domain-containing protein n=1 Tax=Roridomyces roridus TaxID=1738132 RepID=A0AAD7BLS2_9AGAR|nr:hypothetical protein FB45DRAFT_869538 [Roridomyces roridus]
MANTNGHGGFRPRSGRPKGSKNRPRYQSKPPTPPPAPVVSSSSSDAVTPVPTPITPPEKRRTAAPSQNSNSDSRLANFWSTRAPQGTHSMTMDGLGDGDATTSPSESLSATGIIEMIHTDMRAANITEQVSERVFDETVEEPDEEEEKDDGDNEGDLDAEQQSAEIPSNSVNDQWLKTNLERVKQEIEAHGQPRAYRDGQLWIRPKDPIFALQQSATTATIFSPDALYLLPIFLWLPHHLPGHPDRFFCQCGRALNLHSWNRDPIARRVCTTSGSDYFLLTRRYLCPTKAVMDPGCGATYQGTDPWILAQLPQFVQDRFPVSISHRSALDTSQLDMMKITFAGRFGADPFSKMVGELKHLHHSRLESMYLHAALHYGRRGREQIPAFSAFGDHMGYAGYAPSTKYLKSMFISWFTTHRLYIDRIMSSLSAKFIKADHTFKTVDHQGCLPGGEPIHTALYEGVNEMEEVRFYGLTLTQSFAPLHGLYGRLQIELANHGHSPTEILYTDNPRHERNWHENTTPSLKQSVQHIILDPFRDLPQFNLTSGCETLFASSPDRIDTLADQILLTLLPNDSIYVALAVQYTAEKIRAIQVQTKTKIYVFDVGAAVNSIPLALKSVLTHPRIVKFGHEIHAAAKQISSLWHFFIPPPTIVDLGKLAKLKGAASDPNCSLSTLCGVVLKLRLPEMDAILVDSPILSHIQHLSRDIDCAWSIQDALPMKLGTVGRPLQPSQMRPGQLVALVIGNKTLALGQLVAHQGSWAVPNVQGTVSVTKAYSVIKLDKLLVPGFIVAKHDQTLEWLKTNGGHAVVQTRTLRSRAAKEPHPATLSVGDESDLGHPAPVVIPSVAEQLAQPGPSFLISDIQEHMDVPVSLDDDHGEIDNERLPLLKDPSRKAACLPAIVHEPVEVDFSADPQLGIDVHSFNPMAMRQRESAVVNEETAPRFLQAPQAEPQHSVLVFVPQSVGGADSNHEQTVFERPTKKPRKKTQQEPKAGRSARRCALCAHAKCGAASTCAGKGGREKCVHKNDEIHRAFGFDPGTRKRIRKKP